MTWTIGPSRPLTKYAAVNGCNLILHTPRSWVAPAGLGSTAPGVLRFPSVSTFWVWDSSWKSAQFPGNSSIAVHLVADLPWGPLLQALLWS